MRCTLGTVAVTAVVLLALSAFWPQNAAINLPPRVAAQDAGERLIDAIDGQERDESIPRVEAKLEKRIDVGFTETPLADVVEYISQSIEVDILLNHRSLEDVGVQADVPVTLTIRHTTVAARTVLDVVLEQFDLGYVIRDGFIYVLSAEDAAENHYIEVYNVRDLVGDAGHGHGQAPQTAATAPRVPIQTVQFGGGGGFGGGEGFGGGQHEPPTPETPGQRLIGVIESTVGVPWENIDGMGGTIEEFHGLLVIRTSREGHREIKELLDMMRTAGGEQPPRTGAAGGRANPRRSPGGTLVPSEPGATPLPEN